MYMQAVLRCMILRHQQAVCSSGYFTAYHHKTCLQVVGLSLTQHAAAANFCHAGCNERVGACQTHMHCAAGANHGDIVLHPCGSTGGADGHEPLLCSGYHTTGMQRIVFEQARHNQTACCTLSQLAFCPDLPVLLFVPALNSFGTNPH